ncbi:glycosyltransferase family 8 protein [Mitsuokella multacida]|uniref:glycosyltransferase family 8 protein n=1 Tax=Mitsuokella multacida TaxID=52226 RepID=UPI001F27127C|nr:glycosyltransferase family 8 protein [Mitsuokella multacida]MCF2584139.1 glycosyltransferase family 8 protein [Mitsuokella multacida]
MRDFEASFFKTENFILSTKKYGSFTNDNVEIHICYNVNDAFIPVMGASLISVIENNKDLNIVFHIFTDGYSKENEQHIKKVAEQFHCICNLYKLNMKPFQGYHIKVERFSRITYARTIMAKLLYGIAKRFIYIDADAICIASLKELWNLDLQGHIIAVTPDHPNSNKYRAEYLKLKSGKYFNDGIMLVDVNAWEKYDITPKCFAYQDEPRKRFLGQDQDIMNLVFDGNVYFLPHKYNITAGGDDYDTDGGVFIHWTGRRKPWKFVLTEFDRKWRLYNELSPWPTLTNIYPIKQPKNYHDFKEWGKYKRSKGDMQGYIWGYFWYAVLKIAAKLHL